MPRYRLVLLSPAGCDPLVYNWPLATVKGCYTEASEIVKTIKWVGKDHHEVKEAMGTMCNIYDATSFDNVSRIVDTFNDAIKKLDKKDVLSRINKRPSRTLLKHILNQVYAKAIENPNDLNNYEPFTPEVYGEASFGSINKIIEFIEQLSPISTSDRFIDLGSGIGQVVLQVAALTECEFCMGIEKADIPASRAREMDTLFRRWMAWFGKKFSPYKLIQGDFLSPQHQDIIFNSNLVFVNNLAFGPSVDHQLKQLFARMNNGTRIVSSLNFCPLNFRITNRNMDDIGAIMNIRKMEPVVRSGSWTNTPFSYYLHVIDLGKLEEFYQTKKINPRNFSADELKRTKRSLSPFHNSEKMETSTFGWHLKDQLDSTGSSPSRSHLSSNSSPPNSLASTWETSQLSLLEDITEVSDCFQNKTSISSNSTHKINKSKKKRPTERKPSLNNSAELSKVCLADQNGEDEEGIFGFLPDDIDTEVRRGQHLKCSLCKKNNATVGCSVRSCKKTFHLPCMQLSGGLNQFFGSFDSFCYDHKPKQKVPGLTWKTTKTTGKCSKINKKRYYGTSPCGVCLDMVSKRPSVTILWTPCCSGWFHRNCVEYMAETAGSTFFKCPLCNNKEVFEREMQKFGIYIPIEDAKWETEPSAYEDLYKRHSRCDEKSCLCPTGRSTNQEDTDWEIVLCELCGSFGVHVACGQLDPVFLRWKCETCSGVIFKAPKSVKTTKWLVDSDSDDDAERSSVVEFSEDEEPNALEGCSTDYQANIVPNVTKETLDEPSIAPNGYTRGVRNKPIPDVRVNQRQKSRCGQCAGCLRDNCGECRFCLDMKKFGGPNKLRQACLMRKCNPEIELDDGDHDDYVSIETEKIDYSDSYNEKCSYPTNTSTISTFDGTVRDIWNWNCKIDLRVTSRESGSQKCFSAPGRVRREGLWNWDCRVDVARLCNWKDFIGQRRSELKCQECGFMADSNDLLDRHQRLHDPTRKFVCSICQFRFIKERHLKIHERIHTGEKPHKCDLCGERFAEVWSLKIHMSKHNSKRKYVCRLCKWRFKSSSALKVHEEKHFKAQSGTTTTDPNSFRHITSTSTSTKSSFPISLEASKDPSISLPSSSSEGRMSRRDSQASKKSAADVVELSPSNCSTFSLPDTGERSVNISSNDRLGTTRLSPFLQGLELAHVSATEVSGKSISSEVTQFRSPFEQLKPLQSDLSSLVKIEDTGFTVLTADIPVAVTPTTPVVVPRITRKRHSDEDNIIPVYSRIVTRTKSGVRPKEAFTKYTSPTRTKTDDEAYGDVIDGYDGITDYVSDKGDHIDMPEDIKDSDDSDPVILSSKASSRSSSCSKKSRIVNQLADFLGRGLREHPIKSRLVRRKEKRKHLGNIKNIVRSTKDCDSKKHIKKSVKRVDSKKNIKKAINKVVSKKKAKKKKYAVVMIVDDNVPMIYDIDDLNLEAQINDYDDDPGNIDGDHEGFDCCPPDNEDPICVDPLIDDPVDSFIVADEIILEGSNITEVINNSDNEPDPESDPLEQSVKVDVNDFNHVVSYSVNENDMDAGSIIKGNMSCLKEDSLAITPIELKPEFLEEVDASDDEMSHDLDASIAELSDEILCSEVGTEDTSEASILSQDEDVPDIDADLISGNPDEERTLGTDTDNVSDDLDNDTCSEINCEPDKITDELDERQAMILRMSSCELVGCPGPREQESGNRGSSCDQESGEQGTSHDNMPSQDETLLGMEEYNAEIEETPLVNFLELCEDS